MPLSKKLWRRVKNEPYAKSFCAEQKMSLSENAFKQKAMAQSKK